MIKLTVEVTVRQLLFVSVVLTLVDRAKFCLLGSPCLDLSFVFFASRETILPLVFPVVLVLAACNGCFRRFFGGYGTATASGYVGLSLESRNISGVSLTHPGEHHTNS